VLLSTLLHLTQLQVMVRLYELRIDRQTLHRICLSQKDSYGADYSRTDVFERFSFSPKPDVEIMESEIIRQVTTFAASGDNITDLVMAGYFGREGEVRKVLENGTDVNATSKAGSRPLITGIL